MKAKELIEALEKLVSEHGDLVVVTSEDCGYSFPEFYEDEDNPPAFVMDAYER